MHLNKHFLKGLRFFNTSNGPSCSMFVAKYLKQQNPKWLINHTCQLFSVIKKTSLTWTNEDLPMGMAVTPQAFNNQAEGIMDNIATWWKHVLSVSDEEGHDIFNMFSITKFTTVELIWSQTLQADKIIWLKMKGLLFTIQQSLQSAEFNNMLWKAKLERLNNFLWQFTNVGIIDF